MRNRLARLLGTGLVERKAEHQGRGRPRHTYQASVMAQKRLGQNYAELAVVLWDELMGTVPDRKLRRHLFIRVTERTGRPLSRPGQPGTSGKGGWFSSPACSLTGASRPKWPRAPAGRSRSQPAFLPLLRACRGRSDVCAMERKMFEKVLGRGLKLSQCRLDGDRFCDFEAKPILAVPQT